MALAEAIPGWYPIPVAPFWTIFTLFCIIVAPFCSIFASFFTVSDRSESFSDRFERPTSRKVCENLRTFREKFTKIRESIVFAIFAARPGGSGSQGGDSSLNFCFGSGCIPYVVRMRPDSFQTRPKRKKK
jgi:hypothetical protein